MGKLILVRHGRTSLNRHGQDERLRGWLDVPLDESGLQEAESLAKEVANHSVEVIYSSDLRRARQTADALRRELKRRVIPTKDLRPWNLGVFCGQRVRELLPFLASLNEFPDIPAPGGESFHQFYGRYSSRLVELLNLAERSEGDVVAVTHVRNLLAAKVIIEHGDRDRVPVSGGPPTGAVITVEKRDGFWQMGEASVRLPAAKWGSFTRAAIEALT